MRKDGDKVIDIKKAREICDKYDKLPITPYSKCRKTNRDDYLNQAILILPACLDEIERLQAENEKLKQCLCSIV